MLRSIAALILLASVLAAGCASEQPSTQLEEDDDPHEEAEVTIHVQIE